MSEVQYRDPNLTLEPGNTATPLADPEGRTVVVAVPSSPTDLGRVEYRTSDAGSPFEDEAAIAANSRVVEILYIQLGAVLANAGINLYILVVDKNGAVVANDESKVPFPPCSAPGDMIVWEPPDGVLFTTGVRAIVSTAPDKYTAPAQPEPISVYCRTRNP